MLNFPPPPPCSKKFPATCEHFNYLVSPSNSLLENFNLYIAATKLNGWIIPTKILNLTITITIYMKLFIELFFS